MGNPSYDVILRRRLRPVLTLSLTKCLTAIPTSGGATDPDCTCSPVVPPLYPPLPVLRLHAESRGSTQSPERGEPCSERRPATPFLFSCSSLACRARSG